MLGSSSSTFFKYWHFDEKHLVSLGNIAFWFQMVPQHWFSFGNICFWSQKAIFPKENQCFWLLQSESGADCNTWCWNAMCLVNLSEVTSDGYVTIQLLTTNILSAQPQTNLMVWVSFQPKMLIPLINQKARKSRKTHPVVYGALEKISLSLSLYIYIYIYIYVAM